MLTESSNISANKTSEAAVRSEQAPQVRAEKPQVESPEFVSKSDSNAVTISITTKPIKSPEPSDQEIKVPEKSDNLTQESTAILARRLEEALNNVAGTKVSFGVQTFKGDSGDINFRVVDKDTGETVREFPPESLYSFEGALANDSKGLLVDIES